jgi:chromosome segregation ATPase
MENDTKKIEAELDTSEKRLMDIMNITNRVKHEVDSTMTRTSDANKEIMRLRKLLEELLQKGEKLKKEINEVKEKNFRGAFEKIKENQKRSRAAEDRVNGSLHNIDKASTNRKHIQKILEGPPSFNDTHQNNKISLDDIFRRIRVLMNQSEMLSAMVCGTPRDKCGWCMADDCGTCGGPGCNGTRSLAMEAVKTAMMAENAQKMREGKTRHLNK